jgi:flagellin
MRINTNVSSLTAREANKNTNLNMKNSLEKLSTGLVINKASDDASGMAIADKLRTQASSIGQAISNGNSAVSLIQIADKAMGEQTRILDIVKTKMLQAATATTSTAGQRAIAKDVSKLLDQLNNIAGETNYNGLQLLQKSRGKSAAAQSGASSFKFQMGEFAESTIDSTSGITANVNGLSLSVASGAMASGGTGAIIGNTQPGNASNARALLDDIDKAITQLNTWRADYGSTQNQIESSLRTLNTAHTNMKNAESIIRDVDYASESANFNKQNIMAQAGTYAISQANSAQKNVLRLLQ